MVLALRWVFCKDLRRDSDFSFIHHWLGFYNRGGKCLLRGTDRFLIYSRLRFVSKRLMKNKLKGRVVPVQAMKVYRSSKVQFHSFLTLALDGGEWSASRPGLLTARKSTHWTGGWVRPSASLDVSEKRKIFRTCRESSNTCTCYYTDWANPASNSRLKGNKSILKTKMA